MTDQHDEVTLEWAAAEVHDAELTVPFAPGPSKPWTDRLGAIIDRLSQPRPGWGPVKVTRKHVRVGAVEAGAESDLRHLLESAVLQTNTDFAPTEAEPEDERSQADAALTAAFQAFAAAPDDEPAAS